MSADERLAIWRYATPEERQRVIDGGWCSSQIRPHQKWAISLHDHSCCPWGAAMGGYDIPNSVDIPGWPGAERVARHLGNRKIITPLGDFMAAWDAGHISRDDLVAYLRRLNAEEATQ